MTSAKVDRIIKSFQLLESCLHNPEQSKTVGKERQLCWELRELIVSNPFNSTNRQDSRYSDVIGRVFRVLFQVVSHDQQAIRSVGEETLDAVIRSLLLDFNHSRVIVLLITEISRNEHWRSLIASYSRLSLLFEYSKCSRVISYGVHIINALITMVNRPEDLVQKSIVLHTSRVFDTLGPRIRDVHTEKAFELYGIAADNIHKTGEHLRASVVIISTLCNYYPCFLEKVFARCIFNIKNGEGPENRNKLVGSLNTIKSVWPLVQEYQGNVNKQQIQTMLNLLLCCLYSSQSEVIVASLELLDVVMSTPIQLLKHSPSMETSFSSSLPSTSDIQETRGKLSSNSSFSPFASVFGSELSSMQSSPFGSIGDLREDLPDFSMTPLDIGDEEEFSESDSISDTETVQDSEVIDPLLHADLYEEVTKSNEIQHDSPSLNKPTNIPDSLPNDFYKCDVPNYFCCAAATVARQFLLSGLKGLKNDREVRVSHKMLALNTLSTISKVSDISSVVIIFKDSEQSILEVERFILHEDDQLASITLSFLFQMDFSLNSNKFVSVYKRILSSSQPIRKRALLTCFTDKQSFFTHLALTDDLLSLAINESSSSFHLSKTSSAEFISSINWKKVPFDLKSKWQLKCVGCYMDLLFDSDTKVQNVAINELPRLISNTDIGLKCDVFALKDTETETRNTSLTINLSPDYHFSHEISDFVVESNLEEFLSRLVSISCGDVENKAGSLCLILNKLVEAFPPSVYSEAWCCNSSTSPGMLVLILDLCEFSLNSAQDLSHGLHILSALYAGYCESQIMNVVRQQLTVKRSSLPKLPEQPVLARLVQLCLRILNMYYSIIIENKSSIQHSTHSLLNRPNLTPITRKKVTSRITDISRLIGTNIHVVKSNSFLEAPVTHHLCSKIKGAFSNYTEGIDNNKEQRFTGLLSSAIQMLSTITEMMIYSQINTSLEEILCYLKVIFPYRPSETTQLIHQLVKVVFGKNMANINLNSLQVDTNCAFVMPKNDYELHVLRYSDKFTVFSQFIWKREHLQQEIERELGWMKNDVLSKIHVISPEEIANSLKLFESFVTQLKNVYNALQDVSCKKSIINILCDLCRSGINYSMLDPKLHLLESVLSQIRDGRPGNCEMMKEIAQFLIVLSKHTKTKSTDELISIGSLMMSLTNASNVDYLLEGVRMIVLHMLYVEKKEAPAILEQLRKRSNEILLMAPSHVIHLWILFIHFYAPDSEKRLELSTEYFQLFSMNLTSSNLTKPLKFDLCVRSLTIIPKEIFIRDNNLIHLLYDCLDKNENENYLQRINPTLFVVLSSVYPLGLHEMENQEKLANLLIFALAEGLKIVESSEEDDDMVLMLRILISFVTKANLLNVYNKVADWFRSYVIEVRLLQKFPALFSIWLQSLLNFHVMDEQAAEIVPSFKDPSYHKTLLYLLGFDEKPKDSVNSLETTALPNPPPLKFSMDLDQVLTLHLLSNLSDSTFYPTLLTRNANFIVNLLVDMKRDDKKVYLKRIVTQIDINMKKSIDKQFPDYQELLDELLDYFCDLQDSGLLLYFFAKVSVLPSAIFDLKSKKLDLPLFKSLLKLTSNALEKSSPDDVDILTGSVFMLGQTCVTDLLRDKPLCLIATFHHIFDILYHKHTKTSKEQFKNLRNIDNFSVKVGSDAIGEDDLNAQDISVLITELFDYIQFICSEHKHFTDVHKSDGVTLLIRTLLRLPLLNSIAMISLSAMRHNWKASIEIRSTGIIVVPLVNIHLLCIIDVLEEFSWKINWLGWTTRQQFEDYWMSLFGVLSSTPSGNEIKAENADVVAEQIAASSKAVASLTDILLCTVLFPSPGNVVHGHFIVKHREKSNVFYQSRGFNQLRQLISKVNNVCLSSIFTRNLEKLNYTGSQYCLGQLSALALWTLCGELKVKERDKVMDIQKVKVSMSEYLLNTTCELDTASSVRALFENFSHWLSKGLDYLPVALLSSTVRSMALLSDLFDELQSFEFLYAQMKIIFRDGCLTDNSDLGFVIYILLKASTVVGVESIERSMSDADISKQILLWIETGLTSESYFVREATLEGILYILQSMSLDSLKSVQQYISSFVLQEISDLLAISDPILVNHVSSSLQYSNLVFAVAFRIMEEPMSETYKTVIYEKICSAFHVVHLPLWLLDIITTGVEELVIHSSTYIDQFLSISLAIIKDYSTLSHNFYFALRIFLVCVFKEEVDPRRLNTRKFSHHIDELLSFYGRSERRVCEAISAVLPSVLVRVYTDDETVAILMKLLSSQHVSNVLTMVYEYFNRIREQQRMTSFHLLSKLVIKTIEDKSLQLSLKTKICLWISISVDTDIINRFVFYLNAVEPCVDEEDLEFIQQRVQQNLS